MTLPAILGLLIFAFFLGMVSSEVNNNQPTTIILVVGLFVSEYLYVIYKMIVGTELVHIFQAIIIMICLMVSILAGSFFLDKVKASKDEPVL